MKKKIFVSILVGAIVANFFSGCTQGEKMLDLPENISDGQEITSSVSKASSAPQPSSIVGGVNLYPMNTAVPVEGSGIQYDCTIKSVQKFHSLKNANLKFEDLLTNTLAKNTVNGLPQQPITEKGVFQKDNVMLLANIEIKVVKKAQSDSHISVNGLKLYLKNEIEDQANAKFRGLAYYSSKAPQTERETKYFYLPTIKEGECLDVQVGWIIPSKYVVKDQLVVIISHGEAQSKSGILLNLNGGEKS